jgi:hypothetical protein
VYVGARKDSGTFLYLPSVFLKNVNVLQTAFSSYSEKYDDMSKFKVQVVQNNPKFARFCLINEKLLGQTLESLQIEPIQRIMRYVLMLRECAKTFADGSAEKKGLDDAITCMQFVCENINQKVTVFGAQRMVYVLQENLFKGKVFLVTKTRSCVRFGMLTKVYLYS